jgi:tetratricopeptide (TPR) repeat protein
MVALRPGELPAQVELVRYLDAVAAFEKVAGAAAAAPAWRVALRQWPEAPQPYLALGNQAYSAGSLLVAIDYYRRGLHRRPADPALANNLASVLGELGCPLAATSLLKPIRAGLADQSNWPAVIDSTLAELAALAPVDGRFCAAIHPGGAVAGAVE